MLKTPQNQKDQGLAFAGMEASSPVRSNKFAGNQYSGHSNDGRDVQFSQMPNKKGNQGKTAGPVTANKGQTKFAHPDSVNMGNGPREFDGTRKWEPSKGQNFNGNPDKIQMPQMPNRKGNMC